MLFICLVLASSCLCLHPKGMQVTVLTDWGKTISVSGISEKNIFPFQGKGQVYPAGSVYSPEPRTWRTMQAFIFIFLKNWSKRKNLDVFKWLIFFFYWNWHFSLKMLFGSTVSFNWKAFHMKNLWRVWGNKCCTGIFHGDFMTSNTRGRDFPNKMFIFVGCSWLSWVPEHIPFPAHKDVWIHSCTYFPKKCHA